MQALLEASGGGAVYDSRPLAGPSYDRRASVGKPETRPERLHNACPRSGGCGSEIEDDDAVDSVVDDVAEKIHETDPFGAGEIAYVQRVLKEVPERGDRAVRLSEAPRITDVVADEIAPAHSAISS